jgi:GNAT superfamily N-acetyltransferase
VDTPTDAFQIRLARPDELERLREVEAAAGNLFAGLGLVDEALDVSFPSEDLAHFIDLGQVWVGCRDDGLAVGMVIASLRDEAAYVEELDVLPEHGRRGLGARLLATVCGWAGAQGLKAVALSTFRDGPWNGPFYRRHGFRYLRPEEWTPGMRMIREQEARDGLRADAPVFMRRELDRSEPAPSS